LQRTGYYVAAAVIAGTGLETALRDLCQRNQEGIGTLDRMNAELAKKGVYNMNPFKRKRRSLPSEIARRTIGRMSSLMAT
jgi:hypothetical protein